MPQYITSVLLRTHLGNITDNTLRSLVLLAVLPEPIRLSQRFLVFNVAEVKAALARAPHGVGFQSMAA